ncbi:pentatricopeptide repeat-containing protein At2g22410, mitochondrial-like [Silene latifolia]|uniref:pentatricopeptide repeat-containing protein At2g22410, mitochondrial-like n=1 Tax=Silene latifolia TaxID=37657 RepID=UPI003D789BBF
MASFQRTGCLGYSTAIMKNVLKYLSVIGWLMWNSGFVNLKDFPVPLWLALLVKGTRFTQQKLLDAQQYMLSLKGCLSPSSKCGDVQSARVIFDSMTNKTWALSWNYVIRGYSESWIPVEAVVLYKEMLVSGVCRPDNYTFFMLFKACAQLCSCLMGYMVLGLVLKLGFGCDVILHNGVVHMLVSCGKLEDARQVFDDSCVRDFLTWTSLINGYVDCGKACEALTF